MPADAENLEEVLVPAPRLSVQSFWDEADEHTSCSVDPSGQPLLPAPGAAHEYIRQGTKQRISRGSEDSPTSSSKVVLASFFLLGAGSESLWGALMLCVGTLAQTDVYGPAVMSTMASVQNNSWLWTMVFFTMIPAPASNRVTLTLLMIGVIAMLALAVDVARKIGSGASALPSEHDFLFRIGLNGICTGTVQILAASLSGLFSVDNSAVPGALLLGVTGGPLLLASISLVLPVAGVDPSQTSSVTLFTSAAFLGLALLSLFRLSFEPPPAQIMTVGSCNHDGGKKKEYLCRRLGEMLFNSVLMLLVLLFGMFVVCAVPYGAPHVCGDDMDCQANLPRIMVAACTVSSFVGRFLATLRGAEREIRSIAVSVVLRAIFAGTLAVCFTTGRFPEGSSGQALAIAGVAIITIWGNGLIIDLSKESQRACGHSLIFPCPITAQLTWISLQSGSLLGSLCSLLFK